MIARIGDGTAGPAGPLPPAADTIFEIGSATYVFTATLLACMAEDRLVALGDPVQDYLPAGVELPVRGRPIALADLATHTAGLPRDFRILERITGPCTRKGLQTQAFLVRSRTKRQ